MTAVEWFFMTMNIRGLLPNDEIVECYNQAKEMEKEQMLNAFQESRLTHPIIGFKHETFLDYYNQTFK